MMLGLGLAVTLGTIAPRASVNAQEESPMTAAETLETMEAYVDALFGGGAYETFFADDIVITMTGVPGEIAGRRRPRRRSTRCITSSSTPNPS